ncbi:MAG: hypothetical protein IE914_08065, partial [Thiotrichales bacterium]|nr:hypothetical protein [Thiotrichales bacterium]
MEKVIKPVSDKGTRAVNIGVYKKIAYGLSLSVFFLLSGCGSNQVHQSSPATSSDTAVS